MSPPPREKLFIDSETTIDDIKSFVESRTANPVHINGATVWNFNNHKLDETVLERDLRTRLQEERYVVPFQVGGSWALIYHLLPQHLKQAEILVYHDGAQEYRAYNSFLREFDRGEIDSFRYRLARIVHEQSAKPTDEPQIHNK